MKIAFRWITKRVDMSIRPFSYVIFLAALATEAWLIFGAPTEIQNQFLIAATIFLSAVMATCGWMWSGHINRRLARKKEAVRLLLAIRSEEINRWKEKVYQFIEKNNVGQEVSVPILETVKLLGFYEFISICVMAGTADEGMIRESQKFVYLRLYDGLRDFIEEAQRADPGVYCHFVVHAKRWNEGRPRFKPTYVQPDGEFLPLN